MSWQNKDRQHIWHPYTQERTAGDNVIIVKGEGAYLYDDKGDRYIDGCSSWWTNIHGHAHPHIADKIAHQAKQLEQVIFAGFSHPSAIELAEKLLQVLPRGFSKVFYSDNGSTAVEVAIKMALQYWRNIGGERNKIICFRDAYHGDTFGSMSVSARSVFTQAYSRHLFDVIFIDTPHHGNEKQVVEQLRKIIKDQGHQVTAFIFEPLVMGSSGMKMYNAMLLDQLIAICQSHDIITIADEVMTGFGRTGKMFAIDYLSHVPDIVCLSKCITGGFMPFAATVAKGFIYEAFYAEEKDKMLFHGHSYTGNPLGCAAALASLELFDQEKTMDKIAAIVASHATFAHEIKGNHRFHEVRQCGTILAMEVKTAGVHGYLNDIRDHLYDFFMAKKIILRPLGNVLYILPPYCIKPVDLQIIYEAVRDFAADMA